MNRVIMVMATALVTSATCALSADQVEFRASGVLYKPNGAAATGSSESQLESVDWDKGDGLELQAIFWPDNSPWGFGVSIGTATWDIDDYSVVQYNPSERINEINTLEGDADITAFGASVFRKLTSTANKNSKLSADVELGVRFLSVDSAIEGVYAEEYADVILYDDQSIELDNSVLALVALNGAYELSDNARIIASAGIQIDIDKGKAENKVLSLGTFEAGESEFQAIFGKIGLSLSF